MCLDHEFVDHVEFLFERLSNDVEPFRDALYTQAGPRRRVNARHPRLGESQPRQCELLGTVSALIRVQYHTVLLPLIFARL
jgi:hypothetical protein